MKSTEEPRHRVLNGDGTTTAIVCSKFDEYVAHDSWVGRYEEAVQSLKHTEIQRDRLVRLIRDVLATELDLSIEWHLIHIDTGQPLADIERKLDSGLRRLRGVVNNIKSPRGMEKAEAEALARVSDDIDWLIQEVRRLSGLKVKELCQEVEDRAEKAVARIERLRRDRLTELGAERDRYRGALEEIRDSSTPPAPIDEYDPATIALAALFQPVREEEEKK